MNVLEISKILLLAMTAGVMAGCKPAPKTSIETKLEARRVHTARAEELGVEETIYATGTLLAQDRAVLSAKVPGRLESFKVDLGSSVKKGDLLASIEKRDFELKREQAEAALAQARARLGLALSGAEDEAEPEKASVVKEAKAVLAEATKNRDRALKLREQGIMPEADVESAEAQYQVAVNRYEEAVQEARNRLATLKHRRAELDLAVQELNDTEFRAPFDGVVENRQTSPGEFLNVAVPVLTLVRVDPIRMRVEISERDAPRVRLGQKVYLRLEGSDEAREGKISRLSPVISSGNRMLIAEADFANADGALRPGAFAKADVVVNDHAPGIFVPKNAVVTFAGMQKIFVIEKGKAVEREISLRREKGNRVEVLGPIQSGDAVVLDPGSLRNGQPVEILNGQS